MALISIAVSWGFGRHLASLDTTRSFQAIKYDYIQQPFHLRILLGRDCPEVHYAEKIPVFTYGPAIRHQRIYRHNHYGTVQTN